MTKFFSFHPDFRPQVQPTHLNIRKEVHPAAWLSVQALVSRKITQAVLASLLLAWQPNAAHVQQVLGTTCVVVHRGEQHGFDGEKRGEAEKGEFVECVCSSLAAE